MGNVPNKWTGRGLALLATGLAAAAGWALGDLVGVRLAYGFTFDWYVHPAAPRFPPREAFIAVALASGLAAALTVCFLAAPTAWATRAAAARVRYVPPRHGRPVGVDVHAVRLVALLGPALGFVAFLLAYLAVASPTYQGGSPIQTLRPEGYRLLVAGAAALGAGVSALVTVLTVFSGILSGQLGRGDNRNVIARLSLFGMRHAKATLAVVLAVTVLAAAHARDLNTNVDVADVLPRGDPNTDAAHNLTQKFKSSFTQQVTFQFRALDVNNSTQRQIYDNENAKLEDRATEPRPGNISDEIYVRAIDEVVRFVLSQPSSPFVASTSAPDIFKLINWTLAGGDEAPPETFRLPDDPREYALVEDGVFRVSTTYAAVDALTSPTWRQTATLITIDPNYDITSKQIGEKALEIREAWLMAVKAGKTHFSVFGEHNPPQFSVDLPLANAHASALTAHDFKTLLPIIGLFIALTLFIAFRNVTSVVATFSMLAIAVTWTFGTMAWMDIPLNTLNLAVVPLIMGVGIDYGIHMMNEYQEQRHLGKRPEEAWVAAGGGSALALFIGMLTTAAGLVVMIVSPSLIVAQLGILAIVALVSCYLLSVLFIPAIVTILGERKRRRRVEYRPSRVMPALATAVSRTRWAVLLVLVLVATAAYTSAQGIHREAFGDPPRNWLDGDPLRQEHERAISGFYDTTTDDVKANILIFEGDMTTPEAHAYIGAVTDTLRGNAQRGSYTDLLHNNTTLKSRVIGDTLKDLPFIMRTYLTVRGGVPGAAQYLGAEALGPLFEERTGEEAPEDLKTYPETQREITAVLEALFRSPLRQFGNTFIHNPSFDTAVTIFSVKAATYPDAEAVWNEIQSALLQNEHLRPEGVHVSFFGNTAINYLFVAKQVPWLGYMSIATNILVGLIVFAFTRNLRATALVSACNFLTSTLWLGVLPMFGIGLAINLTLPLVFIFAMGSDYGLHLAMRCRKSRDTRGTFESVGKGVLYSFLTTFGAFLVFTQISDLSGRRSMVATAIAIAVVFATTLLVVPIFYPVKKRRRAPPGERTIPVVETPPAQSAPVAASATPATGGEFAENR